MVCLQELIFLFVFNLDLNQNTHEDCQYHPRECQFLTHIFSRIEKSLLDALGFCCLLVLFSSNMYFEEFHHVVGHPFLSFAFRYPPVLFPKYPFPIFYHVNSKSINKPSSAFPCVSVSLQTLKQHFSRALQSRIRYKDQINTRGRMRTIQNFLLFKCNGQYGKYQIVFQMVCFRIVYPLQSSSKTAKPECWDDVPSYTSTTTFRTTFFIPIQYNSKAQEDCKWFLLLLPVKFR